MTNPFLIRHLVTFLLLVSLNVQGQKNLFEPYEFATPVDAVVTDAGGLYSTALLSGMAPVDVPKGAKIKLIGKAPFFYRAIYKNISGYIHFSVIDATHDAFLERNYPKTDLIGQVDLNTPLRETTSFTSNILNEIPKGEKFRIIADRGSYWQVAFDDKLGFIGKSYAKIVGGDASEESYLAKYPGVVTVSRIETQQVERLIDRETIRTYIRGPRGGCYYLTSSGHKVYVDRSPCN